MIIFAILGLVIGYLLGSVSPAYILGKIMRKIDIRYYGAKTAGASNAFRVLGPTAGIITGVFDFFKGLIAMYIASLFGLHSVLVFLAGVFAIIGHDYPFYLRFRGGKGAATAFGMIIFYFGILVKQGMPLGIIIGVVLLMLFLGIITKSFSPGNYIGFPSALFLIVYYGRLSYTTLFLILLSVYVFVLSILITEERKEIKFEKIKVGRKLLRVVASVFPIVYIFSTKQFIVLVIASVAGVFIIVDLLRFLIKRFNDVVFRKFSFFYKDKERKNVSGMVWFLLSSLIVVAFFRKEIAVAAMLFIIFGDTFAEIVGLKFGRCRIFGKKTVEGSLACFMACFIVGFVLSILLGINLLVVLFGSIAATLAELFTVKLDDNLTISIIAAIVMSLI